MLAEIVRAWLVKIRKNSGTSDVGARRRVNFIEGTNITLTLADDADDDEVDVQIAAAAHAPQAHALGGAEHSAATLAELNAKVSDATLDTSSATRDPNAHALGGAAHSADTLADLNTKVSDATLDDSSDTRTPAAHDLGGAEHSADTKANLNTKVSDDTLIGEADVDDTPVDGATAAPVSSNWAFDHGADTTDKHTLLEDADGDTKIQVEESADEDIVRMDTAGTEAFLLSAIGVLTLAKQPMSAAQLATTAQVVPIYSWQVIAINSEVADTQNELDITRITGTADATEANKLHDADGGFATGDVGKRVWNTTDNTYSYVTAFVDDGELTLNDDMMANGEGYILYFSKYTATEAGVYVISGTIITNGEMTDQTKMLIGIYKNGIPGAVRSGVNRCLVSGANNAGSSVCVVVELAANDYVQLCVYHTEDPTIDFSINAGSNIMQVAKIA